MPNVIYHSDDTFEITSEEVRLHGKTLRVLDITSVKLRVIRADPYAPWMWPLLLIQIIALMFYNSLGNDGKVGVWGFMTLLVAVASTISFFIVLTMPVVFRKLEYLYVVRINGSFGGINLYALDDEAHIRQIVNAIDEALLKSRAVVSELAVRDAYQPKRR